MFNDIKKLKEIFNLSGISNFYLLFILIFVNSFFELISIGMLIPYLSLILDPFTYEKYYNFAHDLDITILKELFLLEKKDFLLFLTFFILILFVVKFLINILFSYYLSYSKIKYEKKVSITIMNNFVNSNDFSYLNFPVSKILHDITDRVSNISTCVINFGNLLAEAIIFTSIILFIIFSSTDKNFYIFLGLLALILQKLNLA